MQECQLSGEYVLDVGHIDGHGIARPSAVVDFMQDIAIRHAGMMGLSGEELAKKHAFWVLSRLKYKLSRPLHLYETLRLTTMPRKIRGAAWYRDFIFEASDGIIGSAVTAWAMVDMESHRLARPQALGFTFEGQDTGQREMLKAIRAERLEPCFERVVRYSDIDLNHHLNNVKAIDILSDAFGLEYDAAKWVSQMQVNYISETRCGTVLTLKRGTNANGSLCVSAFDGEKENVQAEVIFSAC